MPGRVYEKTEEFEFALCVKERWYPYEPKLLYSPLVSPPNTKFRRNSFCSFIGKTIGTSCVCSVHLVQRMHKKLPLSYSFLTLCCRCSRIYQALRLFDRRTTTWIILVQCSSFSIVRHLKMAI
jgi:hypothetical protein